MSADELDREVNRLYWKTAEPVTRLAEQLQVSRGTLYNHLRPLPAGATCSTCGGRLLFRTRSSRDSGDAHCGECGADEQLGDAAAAGFAPAAAKRAVAQQSERDADVPGFADNASRILSRVAAAALPARLEEDERRTQLLVLAVSAAVLGLGILYYSRHRS
ncbi:MAG TPA: hypothetical protein VMN78_09555 [Longimicrobiales bacterium]|nr:hypothetical protein [Longimicrobiales bacterium]